MSPHHVSSIHYLEFASAADRPLRNEKLSFSPPASSRPEQPPQSMSPPHTAMSYAEWKREPSTFDVFFGLALPYRPPGNAFGRFFWRWRVWLETTFALSMMQPWEKVFVVVVGYVLFVLLLAGVWLYLPQHFAYVHGRTMYYLLGNEAGSTSTWPWSAGWSWAGNATATSPAELVLSLREV